MELFGKVDGTTLIDHFVESKSVTRSHLSTSTDEPFLSDSFQQNLIKKN